MDATSSSSIQPVDLSSTAVVPVNPNQRKYSTSEQFDHNLSSSEHELRPPYNSEHFFNPSHHESLIQSPLSHRNSKSLFSGYKGIAVAALLSIFLFLLGFLLGLWRTGLARQQCQLQQQTITGGQVILFPGNQYNATLSELLQNKVNLTTLEEDLRFLAGEIHQPGSERNNYLADYLATQWRTFGWPDVRVHNFTVSLSVADHPTVLQLLNANTGIVQHNFPTTETLPNGQEIPIYQAYSRPGSVKNASFIYVHYARAVDFSQLEALNVSVCRAVGDAPVILIARLGSGSRTSKVTALKKFCAKVPNVSVAGMLLYPDPQDFAKNGTDPANVYPNSWWLPGDAPVWGNVLSGNSGGGDYRTEGVPSIDGTFTTKEDDKAITPYPVQPISYNDARILFNAMDAGPVVPKAWARSLAKRIGPSTSSSLSMIVNTKISRTTLRSTVAVMPGSSPLLASQTVLFGNHRDAWLYGASDPISGTVILHNTARLLGAAYQQGLYRPRRSIVLASWDGEEPSLMGSAEFVNQWHRQLVPTAVAYINLDCPIKGFDSFSVRSDTLLFDLAVDASKSVQLNATTTLYDDWTAKIPLTPGRRVDGPKISSLGGGSDHISFSFKYGIPSVYPEYRYTSNVPNMPSYHTKYDNVDYMLTQIDQGMRSHAIVSRYSLDLTMRLADTFLIGYSLPPFIRDIFQAMTDIEKSNAPDLLKHQVNFDAVKRELNALNASLPQFYANVADVLQRNDSLEKYLALQRVNDILLTLPRTFLVAKGLPSASYFQNIIYSTSLTNSYAQAVLIGVQAALLKGDTVLVRQQFNYLIDCVHAMRVLLEDGGMLGSPFGRL